MIFLGSKLVGALRSYATFLFDGAAPTVVPEPTADKKGLSRTQQRRERNLLNRRREAQQES